MNPTKINQKMSTQETEMNQKMSNQEFFALELNIDDNTIEKIEIFRTQLTLKIDIASHPTNSNIKWNI